MFSAGGFGIDYPDAGAETLFLFRLLTVRNPKFSAIAVWQRTDRCLMPWRSGMPYILALADTFWGFQVSGSRQKIKNFILIVPFQLIIITFAESCCK